MAYDISDICNYIIYYENKNNRSINNLRLQKVLYFIQAQFLVSKNEPCFYNEIEAWDFGPVVLDAYDKYKIYGASIIPKQRNCYWDIEEEDCKLINNILNQCSQYSNTDLVYITHQQEPWIDAFNNKSSRVIDLYKLKEFFK